MSAGGMEFLENWIQQNVTQDMKDRVDGDGAALAMELAERLMLAAGQGGFNLDDFEPEFGTPETIIREALDTQEGTPGD